MHGRSISGVHAARREHDGAAYRGGQRTSRRTERRRRSRDPCPPRARSAGCPTDGGNEHPKAVRSTMGGEHPSGAKWKPLVDAARQRLLLLRTGLDSPDLNRRPLDLEKSPPEPPARSRPAMRAPVSSVGPGERVVCRVFELCRANAVGALSAPTATSEASYCVRRHTLTSRDGRI